MLMLKIRSNRYPVQNFEEAHAVYSREWDAEFNRGGCIRGAEIFDGDKLIARVSQNGRIWPPEPYHPDQKPLWDNRLANYPDLYLGRAYLEVQRDAFERFLEVGRKYGGSVEMLLNPLALEFPANVPAPSSGSHVLISPIKRLDAYSVDYGKRFFVIAES